MAENATQVTISLLPVSLSLVHIPRPRIHNLTHPILSQILQPNPTFLNITCNEIELSLFAEHHMLADFENIARKDRQKQHSRSTRRLSSYEPVEMSYEKWKVLQIDSHSDQLDNSGARVHELSAPLAAAGISILYQSSYMSDFIFVKESRLTEVMILLGSAGFDSYSSDPNLLTSRVVSPLLSPTSTDDSSVVELCPDFTSDGGAVLTRTRSSTDASISTIASALLINPQVTPEHSPTSPRPSSRTKSHSPTSSEVYILSPNLACVGLSDDSVDTWGLKLVKLVAFPELIPVPHKMPTTQTRGSFSSRGRCPSDLQNKIHTGEQTSAPPLYGVVDFPSSSSDSSDSSEEEGYFSHSPRRNRSSSSLISSAASRSYPDLAKSAPSCDSSFKHPAKHLISPMGAPSSLNSPSASRRPAFLRSETSKSHTTVRHARNGNRMSVPFFSFTRTPEGSSLTTDVSLLAALFPPAERHMVICGGELDALDAHSSSDSEDDEESDSESSTLKCLQIDLRRFGLDKHGLVNRFSRVLEQNGINHMYSSTFKTANLLVDKADASRAQALLRSC